MPSWTDAWLAENPDILYGAMRPTTPSYNYSNYWRGQYSNIWDEFQRGLGQQALQGFEPTQTFQDFLTPYPWLQNYLGQSPGARGQAGQSKYAPRTRWLV